MPIIVSQPLQTLNLAPAKSLRLKVPVAAAEWQPQATSGQMPFTFLPLSTKPPVRLTTTLQYNCSFFMNLYMKQGNTLSLTALYKTLTQPFFSLNSSHMSQYAVIAADKLSGRYRVRSG